MPETNEQFWSWLAGFVDGDGSITIGNTSRTYRILVRISNVDKPILEWIKQKTGLGFISTQKRYKRARRIGYEWVVASQSARIILEKLLPYLQLKKQQAELSLEFQKTIEGRGYHPISSSKQEKRIAIKETIRILNQRGNPVYIGG